MILELKYTQQNSTLHEFERKIFFTNSIDKMYKMYTYFADTSVYHACIIFWSTHLEIKGDDINGYDSLPGVVLQCAGEEGLGEEKTRDPEHGGNALVNPALDELHPLHQVKDPRSQRLQGWVRLDSRGQKKNAHKKQVLNTWIYFSWYTD